MKNNLSRLAMAGALFGLTLAVAQKASAGCWKGCGPREYTPPENAIYRQDGRIEDFVAEIGFDRDAVSRCYPNYVAENASLPSEGQWFLASINAGALEIDCNYRTRKYRSIGDYPQTSINDLVCWGPVPVAALDLNNKDVKAALQRHGFRYLPREGIIDDAILSAQAGKDPRTPLINPMVNTARFNGPLSSALSRLKSLHAARTQINTILNDGGSASLPSSEDGRASSARVQAVTLAARPASTRSCEGD